MMRQRLVLAALWAVAATTALAQEAEEGAAAAAEATAAQAGVALGNPDLYAQSLAALTMLFVLAVLLESAFALIFNWRVFQAYFSARGVRTIIMVAGALALVNLFDIDIVASLVAAYNTPKGAPIVDVASGPASVLVTALILAGGSSGVHNIMKALGYRSGMDETAAPTPPRDKAWVAVRVRRQATIGPLFVHLREGGPADANSPSPIAGMVLTRRPTLRGLLLRDASRFPQSGGYQVKANTLYRLTVEGKDAQGNPVVPINDIAYVFADGAIVDLEATA